LKHVKRPYASARIFRVFSHGNLLSYLEMMIAEKSMWQIKLGVALGTVALTGLVGAGVGVGYYVVKANEYEEHNG
jgi:hypothetical protein